MACTGHTAALSFDIFCRVIDNYGDIGVCWRLARQLAGVPHHCTVRLWVDDMAVFQRIEPRLDTKRDKQRLANVDIVRWTASPPKCTPHRVVIEAFACDPPTSFIARMMPGHTLWINLDYLSAESWVADFHLQPSIQPGGLKKTFFFPGFSPDTGGLLRESNLMQDRQTWMSNSANRLAYLQSLGVPADAIQALQDGARLVFLFCYPHAPVDTLIHTLEKTSGRSVVLAPQGILAPGAGGGRHKILAHAIPFVPQADFDRLLWSSDINFVRGEDSLVRALWAGRPMIWQPYPQSDQLHMTKLDALLERSPLDPTTQAMMRAWSTKDDAAFATGLAAHLAPGTLAHWHQQAVRWAHDLARHKDLVTSLLDFCAETLRTG